MADPRDTPLSTAWSVETPDNASMIVVGRMIAARCGAHVVALDRDGRALWQVDLGTGAGEGAVLLASEGTIVTDTRGGPKKTTMLCGVRDGSVVYRTAMDCLVASQGSCIVGDEVFVVGTSATGTVLRSVHAANGARRLDVARKGRDVLSAGDSVLLLDSFNEPGVVSLDRNAADEHVIARQPAQEFALAGDKLLAALRTAAAPHRTAQLLDLRSGAAMWSHPCHGASIGLDDELAMHVELAGSQFVAVARDTKTGAVRWRGQAPLGDDTGTFRFAGSLVAFTHGTGTTVYRRESGALVGELLAVYALAAHERYLFLEGSSRIACIDGAA